MTGTAPVDWPASWRSVPLWSLFQRLKDVGHADEEMLSVYRDHGVVQKESRSDNFNKTAENRDIYQLVHPGWLIVNRMKAWQGSVGISPFRGIVSGHYICFRPQHGEEPRFLNYLLRSNVYATELARLSRGVRPNQIEIDNDLLRVLVVRLPPLETQHAIADFLDAETRRIDRLVAMKQKLVQLLDERIDARVGSLIGLSALGGGGHVELVPIRRVLTKVERWAEGGDVVTAFRDGTVTTRAHRDRDNFTNAWTDDPRVQSVEVGDVVVHGLDGFSGAIGDAQRGGVCSPVYHVCNANGGDSTFYGRLLRQLAVTGYLGSFATSTRERAVDLRNWDLFGRIPIPLVPIEEQLSIGAAIRRARELRDGIYASEVLALEHRQALITAAVTGQLDLSKGAA